MRLKVPFLRYVLAGIAFLLPSVVLAGLLPFLVNSEPIKAKLVRTLSEWTGGEVKLSGSMAIEDFFSLSVEAQDVYIGHFKGLDLVEGMKADRLVAYIDGFSLLLGRFKFDKVRVYGAVMQARASGPGEVAAAFTGVVSGPNETPFRAFHMEDGLIALRSGKRKPYRRLEVKHAKVRAASSGRQLDGSARLVWKGKPLDLWMRSAFRSEPGARLPVSLRGRSELISGEFDGHAIPGPTGAAEGTLALRSPSLAAASDWLGLGVDAGPLAGDVALRGAIAMTPQTVSLTSGEISAAGQTAQANLTVELDEPLPRVEGALAFNWLDLKALFAGESLEAGLAQASAHSVKAETDLRLSARALSWGSIEAGPIALTLTLRQGRISAEIAELVFLGGELRGRVALDTAGPMTRATARVSAEAVDSAKLLRLAHQRDWLSGAADINLEAEAVWSDPAEIAENLTARARVNFPEGGQMRLDIPRLASSAALGASGWGDFEFTSASFEHLRFEMVLRAGQISFSNVALAAAGLHVNGRGEIDLASRSLDWRFVLGPEAVPGRSPQQRTEPGRVGSALSIQGPWVRPTIRHAGPSSSQAGPEGRSAAALEISRPER